MDYDAQSTASNIALLRSLPGKVPDISRPFLIAFNCFGMLLSGTLAFVGLFSFSERYPVDAKGTIFSSTLLGRLTTNLDLACLIIGVSLFTVFAIGYVASVLMSENLLQIHCGCLVGLTLLTFLASVTVALVPFIANPIFHSIMKADVLKYYGNNPDWDHLVNVLQRRLSCCGIGPASFRDWDHSEHFHCSADNPSVDRCGVPASCCRNESRARVDRFCGRGAQNASYESVRGRVHNRGCISAVVNVVRGKVLLIGSSFVLVTLSLAIAAITARAMRQREIRRRSEVQGTPQGANDAAKATTRRRVSWADLEDTSILIYQQPEMAYADAMESAALFHTGRDDHGEWLQLQEHGYPNQDVPLEGLVEWPMQEPDSGVPYEEPRTKPQIPQQYQEAAALPTEYYDAAGYTGY